MECKETIKEDISKEVIAFANTNGGTVYVGVNDAGTEVGLHDIDAAYTQLTNIVRDTILPDITLYIRYELLPNNIVKITVGEGSTKPYYLRKNGMKPSGVYVRQGASSVPASWDQIRQFIKYADGDSFETARSLQQELTFTAAEDEFTRRQVSFTEDKYIALGLRDAEVKLYTNLALLLSDQCPHTIKVAVFDDPANTIFIDRREFSGSIFRQLHDTYDYLSLNNRTVSNIKGLDRIDRLDYPSEAIREALLNALIHRDYGYSGSIIINVNKARMEFISLGGLLPGLSTQDIMVGISQPRNIRLAHVFFRLKHIEAYGTGIRRIFELYRSCDIKPEITVTEHTFRIALPNRNINKEHENSDKTVSLEAAIQEAPIVTAQMKVVLNHLAKHSIIDEKELMDLLNVKKTRAYLISKKMAEMGLIDIIGRGRDKQFRLQR